MTTTETRSEAAFSFFNAAEGVVCNLAMRWADEFKYENINDYKAPLLQLAMAHGVTIEKMTKRPFGCEFVADGKRFVLSLNLAKNQYGYRRIA